MDEVADFFDLVPDEELLTVFTFQRRDGNLITVKDKFKAHFHGLQCRYLRGEENVAKAKFATIFEDSILELMKLKRYKEQILKDLQNFDLYQDEVLTTYSGDSNTINASTSRTDQTVANERNLIEGSLTGSTSASTMSSSRDKTLKVIETRGIITKSESKLLDYLDPNTKDVQQTVTLYGGTDRSTLNQGTNSNATTGTVSKGDNKTISTNPFRDRVEFLRLRIPALTSAYFDNYRVLFLC